MKIDLVIFDCDGVLIDSEIICHEVCADAVSASGRSISVDDSIKLLSGASEKEIVDIIQKEYKISHLDDELKNLTQKQKERIFKEVQLVPNILSVISYLERANINKCIASNSSYEYLVEILHTTDLGSYFVNENIFSASHVQNSKPSPDIFLHAVKTLNADKNNCIIIEDSAVGIKAANAANIPVIGFLGAAHARAPWYRENIVSENPIAIANNSFELLNILKSYIEP